MKYHLDTIPVWDAFREEKECSLCVLMDKAEKSYVDSFLGASVMEPSTRVEVNEKGFCPDHNYLLFKAQNRLGLALITHTHTIETIKKMKKYISKIKTSDKTSGFSIFKSKNDTDFGKSLGEFAQWMRTHKDTCIICDRINNTINRYVYTILHLWENDSSFRDTFKNSKGFCFNHLPMVIDMAMETLNRKKQEEFFSIVLDLQLENFDRQEKELLWFTQKFDYRNSEKPWGNSKDSLPRLLQKLTGKIME